MFSNATPDPLTVSAPSPLSAPLALYVHIPFCKTRCTYCAFNTYAGMATRIAPYVQALLHEIRLVASAGAHPPASTLYFGGGTPSQVPVESVQHIIQACAESFRLGPAAEISFETNPGDADHAYFQALRKTGVTRLSIGMQSAHEDELRLFSRRHTVSDVHTTVSLARQAGIPSISLDLIYGVPGQSMAAWQRSLTAALALAPDHLSLYSLSIEEGTPLHARLLSGRMTAPDADLAADMYEWASDCLLGAGLLQYEISNWALPGHSCQHNIHVWQNKPYLGLGAGAHGCAAGIRYENVANPNDYIARMSAQHDTRPFPLSAAAETTTALSSVDEMSDTMILGLRLTDEGVHPAHFLARFGRALEDVYGPALDRLLAQELLERAGSGAFRLTSRGRLLGNWVFAEFV